MPKKEEKIDYQELSKERILKLICDEKTPISDIKTLVDCFHSFTIAENVNSANFLEWQKFEWEQVKGIDKRNSNSLKDMLNQ